MIDDRHCGKGAARDIYVELPRLEFFNRIG